MSNTQQSHTKTNTDKVQDFSTQLGEIDDVRRDLIDLKAELKQREHEDPGGALASKARALEEMYEDLKTEMKEKKSQSSKVIEDMKTGFINAWQELKTAAEKAKRH